MPHAPRAVLVPERLDASWSDRRNRTGGDRGLPAAALREEQAAIYAALIERPHAAGAECAAITSLGGHFCFDETARISSLALVSCLDGGTGRVGAGATPRWNTLACRTPRSAARSRGHISGRRLLPNLR